MNKCKWCNEETKNRKYCSKKCQYSYLKTYKLGFWNSTLQSRLGRIRGKHAQTTLKRLHISAFYNPEIQRSNTIKAQQNMKINKVGFYNSIFQKEMSRRGSSKAGKIGGPRAIIRLREKKNNKFNRIYFDSMREMEIGMCIHYQIEKLIERKNYQVKIGSLVYDFFIKNTFIEYHPIHTFFTPNDSSQKYYIRRRKNLNKHGYKDYKLIIIK